MQWQKRKSGTVDIYRQYGELCLQVERELLKRKRISQNWEVRAGLYTDDANPEGAGVQFYRPHWFNEAGKGLHFETWVKKSYHEEEEMPFVFHIEVGKARARFGQKDFRGKFLEDCGDVLVDAEYEINPRYAWSR